MFGGSKRLFHEEGPWVLFFIDAMSKMPLTPNVSFALARLAVGFAIPYFGHFQGP